MCCLEQVLAGPYKSFRSCIKLLIIMGAVGVDKMLRGCSHDDGLTYVHEIYHVTLFALPVCMFEGCQNM